MFSGWEVDNGLFPKPMLEENKVYACKDVDGDLDLEFPTRFCFGGGEYWWKSINGSNLGDKVTHFSRGKLSTHNDPNQRCSKHGTAFSAEKWRAMMFAAPMNLVVSLL